MCDVNRFPDITRILVEVEDRVLLSFPGDMNGLVHHVHDVRMNARCVCENVGDTLWIELLDALRNFLR